MGIKKRDKTRKIKLNKKTTIFCIIVFILLALFLVYDFILMPRIDLKDGGVIKINYKEKYSEKGYTAHHFGKDLTKDVKVSGKVNTDKIGTYKITYEVGSGFFKRTVVRTVEVKDLEKPKLEVNKDDAYVCPGSNYKQEEAKATDNYDGDLTKKIKVSYNKDKTKVTYSVTDSSGNTAEVVKKIYYKDKTPPEITLEGGDELVVSVGNPFTDPGAKANDNCDGDVSGNIKAEGSVDTSKAGDYEITYTVSDKAGNKATKKRTVKVTNGIIYLTFDDGPNSGTTNVILDILKEEGVKATFFVTNFGPDELIKREYDEGHTVALHTAVHDYAVVYASDEAYFNDLASVQNRVKNITGEESKIVRFPGGSSNTVSRRYSNGIMSRLTKELVNRGYKYYDWNISSGDAEGGRPAPEKIYNNVISQLRPGRVNMVLMHDIKTYTRDALRDIIKYGKNNGYSFEKITLNTEMVTQRVNN